MTLPIGSIIMWKSGAIPAGWAVCNGTGATPDLVDKFIIGAGGDYRLLDVGGDEQHTHTHTGTEQKPNHTHGVGSVGAGGGDEERMTVGTTVTAASPNHSHNVNGADVSYDGAHSHTMPESLSGSTLPEYISRVYIMRVS